MLRLVKTKLSLALTVATGLVAGACGGGATQPNLPPGPYYNLIPGMCAEYSNEDGGQNPSVGMRIQTATNPPGIELLIIKHDLPVEDDYLSFATDGGGVFLAEREYPNATGMVQEVYTTPLKYLAAPPLTSQTLDSSSLCGSGSVCSSMALDVSVLPPSKPYTGALSVPDGGMIETELYFTYTYDNDGGLSAAQRGIVPGIGFTDLLLLDDTMNLSHYLLADIIPDPDGNAPCAEH